MTKYKFFANLKYSKNKLNFAEGNSILQKQIDLPEFLREYMCHPLLYLTWKVEVFVTQDNEISIFSDCEKQVHRIFADQQRLDDPEIFKPGWFHELLHAVHAESIDPLFACPYLSESHYTNDRLYVDEVSIFRDCWQLVDIWIDDMM